MLIDELKVDVHECRVIRKTLDFFGFSLDEEVYGMNQFKSRPVYTLMKGTSSVHVDTGIVKIDCLGDILGVFYNWPKFYLVEHESGQSRMHATIKNPFARKFNDVDVLNVLLDLAISLKDA